MFRYDYRRAAFFRDRNIQKRSIIKWGNALQKVHVGLTISSFVLFLSGGSRRLKFERINMLLDKTKFLSVLYSVYG